MHINWAVRRHNKIWVVWGIRRSLQLRIDVDSHHISKQEYCFIGILWFRIGKIGIHYCLCYFQSVWIDLFGTNLQRIPSPLSTLLVIFIVTLSFLSTDLQRVSPHEELLEYNILLGDWKPFLQFLVFGAPWRRDNNQSWRISQADSSFTVFMPSRNERNLRDSP